MLDQCKASMVRTNGPGSGMPNLGVRIAEGIAEEDHAHVNQLGRLLNRQPLHDAPKGKGGCFPASPVLRRICLANVLLQPSASRDEHQSGL